MNRMGVLALVLLGAFGLDLAGGGLFPVRGAGKPLRIPFDRFPRGLLGPGWGEEDRAMADGTARIANVSDYLQRVYTDGRRTIWLYVGYVPGWNPAGIHYPGVCFPSVGMVLQEEKDVTVPGPGIAMELRFKESRWSREGGGGDLFSLTAFYYRGGFAPSDFSLRRDSILGIDYYAIVTVAGDLIEDPAQTRDLYYGLLRKAVPEILKHFPE